ncbi:restriction endonuclease subunit S [Priestia megaterium]|uniref:restriction endonuclease subunit S n=1 Tax=Priestia megaterium TaxID=1404 RepID=UPI003CFD5A1D
MISNENWSLYKLKDVSTYISRGKQPKYVNHSNIRTLNQKAIQWGEIVEDALKFHNPEVNVAEKHFIRKNDVVINSTGTGTVGRTYNFKEDPPYKLFADSHVTIVRTDQDVLNSRFLTYQLSTRSYQEMIVSSFLAGSTGQVEFNKSKVESLPVYVPDIKIQNAIVEVLDSLDSKIEVNKKIIKNLDILSREIFKHWFIDFEFPNEQGQPYKSNGGEMVESELGEIPKGFKVKDLGDIADVKGGKRLPKGERIQEEVTNYPYLRVKDFTSKNRLDVNSVCYISEQAHEKIKNYTIDSNDLFISIAGTIGITGIIPSSFSNAHLTENAAKITNYKECNKYFIMLFLLSELGKKQIMSSTVGSTQPKLPLYGIKGLKVCVPTQNILNDFTEIIDKLYLQIETLESNIHSLNQIRDTLLPKLLSGEIEMPKELVVE